MVKEGKEEGRNSKPGNKPSRKPAQLIDSLHESEWKIRKQRIDAKLRSLDRPWQIACLIRVDSFYPLDRRLAAQPFQPGAVTEYRNLNVTINSLT